MNCCCTDDAAVAPASTGWHRRVATLMQWALPVTTLALIPKCPACVAGYVLLFTGLGLSFPAAAAVRWTLIALSIAALAYLLVRAARRALAPRVTKAPANSGGRRCTLDGARLESGDVFAPSSGQDAP